MDLWMSELEGQLMSEDYGKVRVTSTRMSASGDTCAVQFAMQLKRANFRQWCLCVLLV